MTRRLWTWPLAALGIVASGAPAAALASSVALSVRYAANGPGLAIASVPERPFRCARMGRTVICTTAVPRGTAIELRARTHPRNRSPIVSALSLPIDGKAWGGACARTPADVCRLRATRALSVQIDTHDP